MGGGGGGGAPGAGDPLISGGAPLFLATQNFFKAFTKRCLCWESKRVLVPSYLGLLNTMEFKKEHHLQTRERIPTHYTRLTATKLVCLASLTVTMECTSSISFCFSSSSKCMYHLARRVLPALFWIKMNRICSRMG